MRMDLSPCDWPARHRQAAAQPTKTAQRRTRENVCAKTRVFLISIRRSDALTVAQMVGTIVVTRLAKIALIAALAAYALIVAYDNIVDYGSNYEFVRHVLSMDTTFAGNALKHRAITDEAVWKAAYAMIIGAEWLTGLLLTFGAIALLRKLTAPAAAFNRAKAWAVAGLTVGFGLWFFGFVVIAGQYFAMWQSQVWNGQESAFRIAAMILGVLIFVILPDGELASTTDVQTRQSST
jgi:predicted small integral membrane protein